MTLVIIGTTISLLMLAYVIGCIYLLKKLDRVPHRAIKTTPSRYKLVFDEVHIPIDSRHLRGWYIPCLDGANKPSMVILHGWGGNASSLLPFAPLLHELQINLLFLNASSHGNSDKHNRTTMVQFARDINAGLDWLTIQKSANTSQLYIFGHSNAAAAALLVASQRKLQGVIGISVFTHSIPVLKQWIKNNSVMPWQPIGWSVVQYMQYRLGHHYDDIAPINTLKSASCPILLIHGENDELEPMKNIDKMLKQAGNTPVERCKVTGAGHESMRIFKREASKPIIAFLTGRMKN